MAEHTWKRATCTKPRTCLLCGETKGNPLGGEHSWDEGVVLQEPTADQPGIRQQTCETCGEIQLEAIEAPSDEPMQEKTPLSGGTIFVLILVGLVVILGGTGLLIYRRQMKVSFHQQKGAPKGGAP